MIILASAAALTAMAQSKESPAKNVTGNWNLTVESQNGTTNPSVILKQEGETLTGTYKGRFGDSPLKGTVKGNDIQFTVRVEVQGQEVIIDYAGKLEGNTMKGTVKFGDFGDGTFTAKKE
jgi:hypothetical protein